MPLLWSLAAALALPASLLPAAEPCDEAVAHQEVVALADHGSAKADCEGTHAAESQSREAPMPPAHGEYCAEACALLCALGSASVSALLHEAPLVPAVATGAGWRLTSPVSARLSPGPYRPPRRLHG